MNKLTEFDKLRLFFDKIGLKYEYEQKLHTNQIRFYVEDLYLWDIIDLKRNNYIEMMVHINNDDMDNEVYTFNTAKGYIRFIMSYFNYINW